MPPDASNDTADQVQPEEGPHCAICFDQINERRSRARLTCSHIFHYICFLRWYFEQEKMKCPLCRATIAQVPPPERGLMHKEKRPDTNVPPDMSAECLRKLVDLARTGVASLNRCVEPYRLDPEGQDRTYFVHLTFPLQEFTSTELAAIFGRPVEAIEHPLKGWFGGSFNKAKGLLDAGRGCVAHLEEMLAEAIDAEKSSGFERDGERNSCRSDSGNTPNPNNTMAPGQSSGGPSLAFAAVDSSGNTQRKVSPYQTEATVNAGCGPGDDAAEYARNVIDELWRDIADW